MSENSRTKRSKQRKESGIHGKHYERKVLALIAIQCLCDKDIQNFWILSNPEDVEKFDDVILLTEHRNGEHKLHMVQIKHKDEEKMRHIVAEKLDGSDSKLGLMTYQKAFLEIISSKDFLKSYELPGETQMFFILFSNCKVNHDIINENIRLDVSYADYFKCIDTSSDKRSVLKIINRNEKYDQNFLDKFYFYTDQIKEDLINNEIGRLLGVDDEIVKVILNFFYEWVQTKDGFSHKLHKLDLKVKLLEILTADLQQQVFLEPSIKPFLGAMLNKFDVTIITQKDSAVVMWSEIFHEIQNFCESTIEWKTWKDCASKNDVKKLHAYIAHAFYERNMTIKLVYILMVIKRKVPFFITTTNKLFKGFRDKLLPILDIYSIIFNESREDIKFPKTVNVCDNFTNIEEKCIEFPKKIMVSFQGKADVDLYSVIKNSRNLKKNISIDNFIQQHYKRLVIGESNYLPPYYINRRINIPIVQSDIFGEKKYMFFIFNYPNHAKLKKYKCIDLIHYIHCTNDDVQIFSKSKYVIATTSEFQYSHIKLIQSLSRHRPYYAFTYINENAFLLLDTNGSIEMLKPYLTCITKKDVDIYDIYKVCNINIIINNAGMGKSMFLYFIKLQAPPDEWVVNVDLKKHSAKIKTFKTAEELINFSYECQIYNISEEFRNFFRLFYKSHPNKIIWLIDDYEEVNEPKLLRLLKSAAHHGFKIWIVGRPYLKFEFENIFGVLSMELTEFNEEDQLLFIEKYLKQMKKSEESITNIKAAVENIRRLLDDSFIGSCQQTMMLTEILLNHENNWKERNWHIDDVYEEFIKLKVNDNWYIRTISKLALKVFFTNDALSKVFDLEELEEDINNFKINYPKDFFITEFTNDDPIFSHKTYAEFLAARWLVHTLKKYLDERTPFIISNVFPMLFLQELTSIRLFFDNMVTKQLPLHSAIVNKENDKISHMIEDPMDILSTDLLGRTIFHLLSSYGSYFDIGVTSNAKQYVKNLEAHSEIEQKGEYVVLHPIESGKPVPSYNYINECVFKITVINNAFMEDTFLKLNSIDYALMSGSLYELDVLLRLRELFMKSSLNISEEKQYYLLFHCIQNKYNNILSGINIKGLNKVKIGHSGMSLLHLAVTSKNMEAVKKLTTEYSLNEWDKDNGENSVFHVACDQKNYSLLDYFLQLVDMNVNILNEKNLNGQTPLHFLARRGHSKLIKMILEKFPNIDIEAECDNGDTPFIISVLNNHIEVATLLKSYGANINHTNNKNLTALHYAAARGFIRCVEKLLGWDSSVNEKDTYGMTPLMKASTWGHRNIVALLLRNKAKVNLVDQNKWTALHHAVRRNNIDVIVLLLRCKSSINCVNKKGETPLMIACKNNFPKAVKILLSKNITFGRRHALRISMRKNHVECMDLLFQAGFTL